MATQLALDKAYMSCAIAIAALSQANRKKVGAVLVAPNNRGIIAEGFNGTPSKFDNTCERVYFVNCFGDKYYEDECSITKEDQRLLKRELETKPEVLHAESNVIGKIARSTNSSDGSTLYVTCSPCFECSKLIIQAGIKRIVYLEKYRTMDGLEILKKAGIQVDKLESRSHIE